MAKGSCACGSYTYEVPEPTAIVVCHCIPCEKFAGSNGSTNALAPRGEYKHLSGETRSWTRKGDSGKDVTNVYCQNCSGLVRVEADALPELMIYKPGTLDDQNMLNNVPIMQEMYTRNRPDCFDGLKGIEQKEGA